MEGKRGKEEVGNEDPRARPWRGVNERKLR